MAWGGAFANYTYTLTATGMPAIVTNNWRVDTADPTGITGTFDATFVAPVPEPATVLLRGTGLAGLGLMAWRRTHRA